jgi:hypothetical protein
MPKRTHAAAERITLVNRLVPVVSAVRVVMNRRDDSIHRAANGRRLQRLHARGGACNLRYLRCLRAIFEGRILLKRHEVTALAQRWHRGTVVPRSDRPKSRRVGRLKALPMVGLRSRVVRTSRTTDGTKAPEKLPLCATFLSFSSTFFPARRRPPSCLRTRFRHEGGEANGNRDYPGVSLRQRARHTKIRHDELVRRNGHVTRVVNGRGIL